MSENWLSREFLSCEDWLTGTGPDLISEKLLGDGLAEPVYLDSGLFTSDKLLGARLAGPGV